VLVISLFILSQRQIVHRAEYFV